jgi:metal-responsive CopG/Arc/MetJ family transcriptional regulator
MPSVKLAVSLPEDLLRAVEKARRARRLSRSAVVQSGLRAWLRAHAEQEKVRHYVSAYQRHPESDAEIAEAAALIREAWQSEDGREAK